MTHTYTPRDKSGDYLKYRGNCQDGLAICGKMRDGVLELNQVRWTQCVLGGGETRLARNEKTGPNAASSASKVLRGVGTKKDAKRAAASALTQAPNRKRVQNQVPENG
jgi:hypothetical protein